MVLLVRPTPTGFPANSLLTPMDNTPLHSISSVCHPWGGRMLSLRKWHPRPDGPVWPILNVQTILLMKSSGNTAFNNKECCLIPIRNKQGVPIWLSKLLVSLLSIFNKRIFIRDSGVGTGVPLPWGQFSFALLVGNFSRSKRANGTPRKAYTYSIPDQHLIYTVVENTPLYSTPSVWCPRVSSHDICTRGDCSKPAEVWCNRWTHPYTEQLSEST